MKKRKIKKLTIKQLNNSFNELMKRQKGSVYWKQKGRFINLFNFIIMEKEIKKSIWYFLGAIGLTIFIIAMSDESATHLIKAIFSIPVYSWLLWTANKLFN